MTHDHWHCRCNITRWVDDHFPGVVECRLSDRFGREWIFVEKVAVVTTAPIDPDGAFPQPAFIACEVISWGHDESGRRTARINTEKPWDIKSLDEVSEFQVYAEQLIHPRGIEDSNSG
ncbi:hypothetical protein [Aestuariivirga sp.]|uniref:hypothetical protein n=1 Tax=Aestuariivirga sp. TaxID=2650926 RepID=UPI0039E6D3C1